MADIEPGPLIASQQQIVFERAYLDHHARVLGFLRVYLGRTPAADDLAQDTFLHLWSRPDAFDPARGGLRTYLLGIARKKAADWWRHSQRQSQSPTAVPTSCSAQTIAIKDALSQLDPDLRNVLWLREAEGYSYEELARILDIPLGTVKSRLFAAREQLRQIWKAN
jgi:RNA polymerase sigma-70 factor (ECF subfamily)